MPSFKRFSDEPENKVAAAEHSVGSVTPSLYGQPQAAPKSELAGPASSQKQAHNRAVYWRRAVVRSLRKPWKRQQQQPSWDTVRTVELHEEEQQHHEQLQAHGFFFRQWWAAQGWLLAAAVGALCFMTYILIELGIGALSSVRFGFCVARPFTPKEICPPGAWLAWGNNIVAFCVSVSLGVGMATMSAWTVSRFAPAASGSGIPEIKTMLNGFVLPDVATLRTLSIKVPCLVLAVSSGMALGHEGPMVHVAVCWAQCLSRLFPQFRNELKRRELYSAAAAAGVASAFGTPIGGVLFSLEEVSSHFSSRTLLYAFLASVVATLLLSMSTFTGTEGLTLFSVTYTVDLHPSEYALFALLGVTGGLVGAAFNFLNIRWNTFRKRPAFKRRLKPVQEVALVAVLTLVSSWPLQFTRPLMPETIHAMFDTCNPEQGETRRSHLQVRLGLCTAAGQHTEASGKLLTALGIAAVIRFCQTVVTIGTVCPAGLFVPSLFVGACLGRCLGGSLKMLNAGHRFFDQDIDPGVYSMVGAAAVLGGVCRMTISLVVIMLELTGGLDYVVPFMLAVLLAKVVGDTLNEGIYDLYIVMKGYPFLHEEIDVTFTERCCDIMETDLTKLDVARRPSHADLRQLLCSYSFRGFPVVNGPHFIGYIWRSHLEALVCKLEGLQDRQGPTSVEDCLPYTDSTVMRMVPDAPLSQAHQVFKQLGCRHIFVVGSQGHADHDTLLGLLTKKRFLRFLKDGTVGHMPIVPPSDAAIASPSVAIRASALCSALDMAAEAASWQDGVFGTGETNGGVGGICRHQQGHDKSHDGGAESTSDEDLPPFRHSAATA